MARHNMDTTNRYAGAVDPAAPVKKARAKRKAVAAPAAKASKKAAVAPAVSPIHFSCPPVVVLLVFFGTV